MPVLPMKCTCIEKENPNVDRTCQRIGAMNGLKAVASYLESNGGRDKVMRLLYYSAQFAAGRSTSPKMKEKLDIFGDQLNSCRTVLRLFDDIPMLCYSLSYGLGKEEQDTWLSVLGVAVNALDQLYYPAEHIAWAADCKLLSIKSDRWWTLSSACWALSTYCMVINTSEALSAMERREMLTAIRCFLDFIHAVHWLPSGFLWGGRLKQWQIGLLGILTSVIGLYQQS